MIFERGYFDANAIKESMINDSLNEARSFSAKNIYTSLPTVFLSHKHEDLTDLRGTMGMLQQVGAKIYIDSMDNRMPSQTSADTAKRIKEVIKSCNKFIMLATEKAIESYWCNWELGIGDTYKYMDHIAILPMKQKGQFDFQYKGNEYLQLYPSIDFENGTNKYSNGNLIQRGYYICDPPNKEGVRFIRLLSTWLAS
jgi:hypothetical protein